MTLPLLAAAALLLATPSRSAPDGQAKDPAVSGPVVGRPVLTPAPVDRALVARLQEHLIESAGGVQRLFVSGSPCVKSLKAAGKDGRSLVACLDVDWEKPQGPYSLAVLRFRLGATTIVSENWRKQPPPKALKGLKKGFHKDVYTVDQWVFVVSKDGLLTVARVNLFEAEDDATAAPVGTSLPLDPSDAAIRSLFEEAAKTALQTYNTTEI